MHCSAVQEGFEAIAPEVPAEWKALFDHVATQVQVSKVASSKLTYSCTGQEVHAPGATVSYVAAQDSDRKLAAGGKLILHAHEDMTAANTSVTFTSIAIEVSDETFQLVENVVLNQENIRAEIQLEDRADATIKNITFTGFTRAAGGTRKSVAMSYTATAAK